MIRSFLRYVLKGEPTNSWIDSLVNNQGVVSFERVVAPFVSLTVSVIFLATASLMISRDISQLHQIGWDSWIPAHVIFRIFFLGVAVFLLVRSVSGQTNATDFWIFLIGGFIHSVEGTLFNLSYFIGYAEILGAIAWFSIISFRTLLVTTPILSMLYAGLLVAMRFWGLANKVVIDDYLIGTVIITLASLMGAACRDYWRNVSSALLEKQLIDNERLIDLGRNLGTLSHDMAGSLAVINSLSQILDEDATPQKTKKIASMLADATRNSLALQKFVLNMVQGRKTDLNLVPGPELNEQLRSTVLYLCPAAAGLVNFDVDLSKDYFCSPTALGYAILNAINNSLQHWMERHSDTKQLKIQVKISQNDEDRSMAATVRDNGAGFPEHILPHLFQTTISTRSAGHGLGLRNILRYIEYQGGKVRAHNDAGAVLTIVIPQPSSS